MLRTEKILGIGLLIIMAGFAIWGHFNLQDVLMPVHFNSSGMADGYQTRDIALSIIPGISLIAIALMLWILPPLMPAISRSATVYGIVVMTMLTLMTATQAMLVLSQSGVAIDHARLSFSGVGLLFIILGNYMPKMRRNWVMGIRTPWTLADERVWDKTHRFAGPLFMLSGVITVGGALLAPVDWRVAILLVATVSVCFASYIYSWAAARRLR